MTGTKDSAVDYDVVVVGSGAAGLSACLEASDRGASVLLAESQGTIGGSSALSGGIVMAAGTSVQRAAGIEDCAADLWQEYLLFNQYRVGSSLARRLAFGSGPAIEWLIGLGVEFSPDLIYAAEERAPRSHSPLGRGAGIVEVLAGHVRDRAAHIDVALGRRINRLISEGSRVRGVAVDDDEVRATSVVLATGGFGANPGLWPEHLPSIMAAGSAAWYIGAPGAQGDALSFAAQVGADVVGHDRSLLLPTPDFSSSLEVYFPGWLVMVTRQGRRVVDEATSYAVMQAAHQQHGPLFAVFDDASKQAAAPGAGAPRLAPAEGEQKHQAITATANWNADTVDDMVRAGKVKRGDTLAELAQRLGIEGQGLVSMAERYNDAVSHGVDDEFFKNPATLRPIATAPFYGAELRMGILCLTSKGPAIDANAHVLDRGGQPIPGLYGAGECTGGVMGDMYMGSGNSYANCLVFGRTAGQMAVEDAAD